MKRNDNVHLTAKEARQLVTLLRHYQSSLEADIDCDTLDDGSTIPEDPDAAGRVAGYRRKWKRAEAWVKRLAEALA